MPNSREGSGDELTHWQQCEMPECFNDVPKAKAICDECIMTDGGSDQSTDGADRLSEQVLPVAREMVEFADLLEERGVPPQIVVLAMALSHDIKATEQGAPTLVSETNRSVIEDE